MAKFTGVYVALITPMTDSYEVDYSKLREHADWLINEGVTGLIPCGTCGEYATLSNEERAKVVETVLEVAKNRVPVLVGTGAPATRDAVKWAQHAKDHGAAGLMALPPINYSPEEYEVIAHYEALSEVGLPIVLYNNPNDYKTDLTTELLVKLQAIENVIGVKDFSIDIRRVHTTLTNTNLEVLIGVDDLGLEGPAFGATGWISGFANVFPKESVEIFNLGREGKLQEAMGLYRSLLPLSHYDAQPNLVQAMKYCLELKGRPVGPTRPPRLPLATDELEKIKEAFELSTKYTEGRKQTI
ncbi:dihydrodipicolinate synthase family protein [Peribacillus simplex]|uniref:dihydrodipicolinate synthase family protein n=1 Tax=Peribacillus simplex TaxID=1478 RepID=UPI00366AC2CC